VKLVIKNYVFSYLIHCIWLTSQYQLFKSLWVQAGQFGIANNHISIGSHSTISHDDLLYGL